MEMIPLLPELTAFFSLSIAVLLICHKFRIPPIVGFLLTGVICGPSVLGIADDVHTIELMSEIGIVLLLFTIGIELSGAELRRLRKPVLVGGAAQIALTVAFTLAISSFVYGFREGLLFGFLATLSSTAIVLSLLQQRGEMDSPQGRVSLAILIFQDMAIVPMMLAIPLLAGGASMDFEDLLVSLSSTVVILGGGWILAKFIVPRLMEQVMRTRNKQLLLMTSLALCFAIGIGTAKLGLSLALGAFLAGLLLAESEYSLSAIEGVLPFKDVFTSLFFIAVGMLLDVSFFIEHMYEVFLFACFLIVAKVFIAIPAVILIGYPVRVAILVAMGLAQIGEFSFVLAKSALNAHLLDEGDYQIFLAASIFTMSLTPVMMALAPKIANKFKKKKVKTKTSEGEKPSFKDHLIIVGFGVGGKYLANTAKQCEISYCILEMNPETVRRYRDTEPIFYGDASSLATLEHFNMQEARVVAVAISDPTAVRSVIAQARTLSKSIHIVVRTRFLGEIDALYDLGANDVVPEDFETSIEIFSRVLSYYLVPRQTIDEFTKQYRKEQYNNARQMALYGAPITTIGDIANELEMFVYTIEEGSKVCNKSLIELDVRRQFGISIIAIQRGEDIIAPPLGEDVLLGNDIVYVFGTHSQLWKMRKAFQTGLEIWDTPILADTDTRWKEAKS